MSKRNKVGYKAGKRLFSATADKVHVRNAPASPIMRGGIRT